MYDETEPEEFLNRINGIFAFVLYDPKRKTYLIARDPIGVNPPYVGWDHQENFYVASEMKALTGICETHTRVSPGALFPGSRGGQRISEILQAHLGRTGILSIRAIRSCQVRLALEAAVHRQLMCDVPYGVLISGGVDSSAVAAIAAKFSARRVDEDDKVPAWWPRLHSFAVGLEGAPDLIAARSVAEYIGSVHHEIHFTVQEGLDALPDVIYHLESFDMTSVRATTPNVSAHAENPRHGHKDDSLRRGSG